MSVQPEEKPVLTKGTSSHILYWGSLRSYNHSQPEKDHHPGLGAAIRDPLSSPCCPGGTLMQQRWAGASPTPQA